MLLEGSCYDQLIKNETAGEISVEPSKPKCQIAGGGQKTTIPDVRDECLSTFVEL